MTAASGDLEAALRSELAARISAEDFRVVGLDGAWIGEAA